MLKRLFSYHEMDTIFNDYMPNLNYKVRGIYFEGFKNVKRDRNNKLQNSNDHLYLFPRNYNVAKVDKIDGSPKIVQKLLLKRKAIRRLMFQTKKILIL